MNHEIMVVDAHAIAMIAALRSLGRAGYRIHAVSHAPDALAFKSRFAYKKTTHPDYGTPAFIDWLRDYVASHPIRAIVCGEAFLHAIREYYSEFEHLIPDSANDEVRRLCLSKARVWKHLISDPSTNMALPASGILDSTEAVESFASSYSGSAVFYLKPDREYANSANEKPHVVRVNPSDSIREAADSGLRDYSVLLWQQHVPGMQVGVSLWIHDGQILAENMVLGLHMYPYRAGSMSLRTTWWHDRILDDAKNKVGALKWSGVAMLEYKWDPETDEFWFIELNPRFWGYLHLDLICGKDFPRWQMDAHFGKDVQGETGPARTPRTLRYAPGEVIHLASRLVATDLPTVEKMKSVIKYVTLSVNPKVNADLVFPGDRMLYIRDWIRFLRELPAKVLKNLRNPSYVAPAP